MSLKIGQIITLKQNYNEHKKGDSFYIQKLTNKGIKVLGYKILIPFSKIIRNTTIEM